MQCFGLLITCCELFTNDCHPVAYKIKLNMPEPIRHTLVHYIDEAGHDLFGDWLETLADVATRAAIAARLIRLELGLFGDSKALGEGLNELRIDHGPGWRVYYGKRAGRVVLLIAGSDKSTQSASIKTARKRLANWNQRGTQ